MHDNQPSVVIWFLSPALRTVTSDPVPQTDNNPSPLEAKQPVNQPFSTARPLLGSVAAECFKAESGQGGETNDEMINRNFKLRKKHSVKVKIEGHQREVVLQSVMIQTDAKVPEIAKKNQFDRMSYLEQKKKKTYPLADAV